MAEKKKTTAHITEHERTISQSSTLCDVNALSQSVIITKSNDQILPDLEKQSIEPRTGWWPTFRYALFTTYRRLFSLIFIGNAIAFITIMIRQAPLLDLVNAAAVNLCVCGLARHNLIVNALFASVQNIPRSAPLRLRRIACKVFHFGGVHSGCGVAACIWYAAFVGMSTYQYEPSPKSTAVLVLAYFILALLVAIIISAYPTLRFKMHDYFELTHRFAGWSVILLFWPLLLIFASQQQPSMGAFLVRQPTFWIIIILTLAIIHPWAMVRRVKVTPEVLSTHAIRLHFDYTSVKFGQGISLSRHPLRDWHSFAGFPDKFDTPDSKFSLVVSKAGDWTSDIIQNPPTHIWKRGVPTTGFGHVFKLYNRMILITTGSGIGPCLSFLGDDDRPAMKVLWQTRAPLKTYGQRLIDLVHRMDSNPVILDTSKDGRVDMCPVAIKLYKDFNAEAVCVISNPKMTKQLVYDLECRGIPAFGPIFDS
ncbi:hypothetical protein H2198_009712 [Neophaeococcomyces mojaviensis]|uniref:Uncharacterized protein n=1 Tax=Neophaeococcomyces mojaviensis TaxID=3383035 RepID=A0ACC2ZTV0_9EURO|nr:hypothetical protein H2198_009712 [Knufia sp. JES_112]